MYRAVTGLYMNARFGLGMKQADRAELGEQFRKYVETMISDTFTTLKKISAGHGDFKCYSV